MRDVAQIKAAYDWMVRAFDEQVQLAVDAGNSGAIDRLEATRGSLERGVYVLLFGQFELGKVPVA